MFLKLYIYFLDPIKSLIFGVEMIFYIIFNFNSK